MRKLTEFGIAVFSVLGMIASFWAYGLFVKDPMVCMPEETFAKQYTRKEPDLLSDEGAPPIIEDAEEEPEVEPVKKPKPAKAKAKPAAAAPVTETNDEFPADPVPADEEKSSDEEWP